MGGSGGGGNSGVVRYSPYLEWYHKHLLDSYRTHPNNNPYDGHDTLDLLDALNDASSFSAGTPYDGVFAYGPDTDLANMQDRLTVWINALDNLDPEALFASYVGTADTAFTGTFTLASDTALTAINVETDYDSYVDKAAAKYDEVVDSSDLQRQIDDAVKTFEAKVRAEAADEIARANAGALDIGAVAGTQFHVHMARWAERIRQRVDEYRAQLEIELKRDARQSKAQFVNQGVASMAELLRAKVSGLQTNEGRQIQFALAGSDALKQMRLAQLQGQGGSAQQQLDVSRATIMAKQDETQLDVRYRMSEQLWDLNLFQYAGNFISSIGGSALVPNEKDEKSMLGQFGGAAAAGVGTGVLLSVLGAGAPLAAAGGLAAGLGGLFG